MLNVHNRLQKVETLSLTFPLSRLALYLLATILTCSTSSIHWLFCFLNDTYVYRLFGSSMSEFCWLITSGLLGFSVGSLISCLPRSISSEKCVLLSFSCGIFCSVSIGGVLFFEADFTYILVVLLLHNICVGCGIAILSSMLQSVLRSSTTGAFHGLFIECSGLPLMVLCHTTSWVPKHFYGVIWVFATLSAASLGGFLFVYRCYLADVEGKATTDCLTPPKIKTPPSFIIDSSSAMASRHSAPCANINNFRSLPTGCVDRQSVSTLTPPLSPRTPEHYISHHTLSHFKRRLSDPTSVIHIPIPNWFQFDELDPTSPFVFDRSDLMSVALSSRGNTPLHSSSEHPSSASSANGHNGTKWNAGSFVERKLSYGETDVQHDHRVNCSFDRLQNLAKNFRVWLFVASFCAAVCIRDSFLIWVALLLRTQFSVGFGEPHYELVLMTLGLALSAGVFASGLLSVVSAHRSWILLCMSLAVVSLYIELFKIGQQLYSVLLVCGLVCFLLSALPYSIWVSFKMPSGLQSSQQLLHSILNVSVFTLSSLNGSLIGYFITGDDLSPWRSVSLALAVLLLLVVSMYVCHLLVLDWQASARKASALRGVLEIGDTEALSVPFLNTS
eukprot:GILJ01007406.1.p1 GENE.GILJ01007406.1~~GILJ01007406.1.p1  ORF type:complete len:632 (-),score=52.64 GILJ01007406.1:396-2240(-)